MEAMMFNPPHPGTVLKDYLEGHTLTDVAAHLGVSRNSLVRVVHGKAGISAAMSLKLGEALGTSVDFWFKMQNQYDFWIASQGKRKTVPRLNAA